MCSCLHVVPTEMVPPWRGVIHLHCVVLLDQAEFRLLSSWRSCAELDFCRQAVGVLLMLGIMMVNWKCQGYSKQLWLFILLVCIQCSVPALGDEDLPVGICFSSYPVPFIWLSLRDCFCPSQPSLLPALHFPWYSHSLAPLSFQQAFISVCFPSDVVSSTFLTLFLVLVENACDVPVVSQLHWLWPVPFVTLFVGT